MVLESCTKHNNQVFIDKKCLQPKECSGFKNLNHTQKVYNVGVHFILFFCLLPLLSVIVLFYQTNTTIKECAHNHVCANCLKTKTMQY